MHDMKLRRKFQRTTSCLGNVFLVIVVAAFILLTVSIGMTDSISNRAGVRKQQVKENIHQIQLAIERYATDTDGLYPCFLYGGELNFNIGSVNGINTHYQWSAYPGNRIKQPFDSAWMKNHGDKSYRNVSWNNLTTNPDAYAFGDVLQIGGYLQVYPRNPFQAAAGNRFGEAALGTVMSDYACFGGRSGESSFNLAWFGESPQLINTLSNDQRKIRMDFPGSFAYLPFWSDDASNHDHLQHQAAISGIAPGLPNELQPPAQNLQPDSVSSLDVAGYELLGFGSDRDKGVDIDRSILDSQGRHTWRTGYGVFQQRPDPWFAGLGKIAGGTPETEHHAAPDGVDDFVIIQLGSGLNRAEVAQ